MRMMTENILETHQKQHRKEAGFSLLETLIALAILSITSLVLFQSISTMVSVSSKAVNAGENTLEHAIERKTLESLIGGLVPSWSEERDRAFLGTATGFSGMSTTTLLADTAGLTSFKLFIQNAQNRAHTLVYEANGSSVSLSNSTPFDAKFQYMGIDQKWYGTWPPKINLEQTVANRNRLQAVPLLPEAIRMVDGRLGSHWVFAVTRNKHLPFRSEYLRVQ